VTAPGEHWELLPGKQAGQVDLRGEWQGRGLLFANLAPQVGELLLDRLRVRYEPAGLVVQHQGRSWIQRREHHSPDRMEEERKGWEALGAKVTVLYVKEEIS
jgi:hypothetical protein